LFFHGLTSTSRTVVPLASPVATPTLAVGVFFHQARICASFLVGVLKPVLGQRLLRARDTGEHRPSVGSVLEGSLEKGVRWGFAVTTTASM